MLLRRSRPSVSAPCFLPRSWKLEGRGDSMERGRTSSHMRHIPKSVFTAGHKLNNAEDQISTREGNWVLALQAVSRALFAVRATSLAETSLRGHLGPAYCERNTGRGWSCRDFLRIVSRQRYMSDCCQSRNVKRWFRWGFLDSQDYCFYCISVFIVLLR